MVREPEIVVGTEVQHLPLHHCHVGALRRPDHALRLSKHCIANFLQLPREVRTHRLELPLTPFQNDLSAQLRVIHSARLLVLLVTYTVTTYRRYLHTTRR